MNVHRMRRPALSGLALVGLALAVAGLSAVAGCAEGDQIGANPDTYPVQTLPPATYQVRLTADQERRLGVRTRKIDWASPVPGMANHEVVPMTGVVYDPAGASWIYIYIRPQTYLRAPVVIDHIEDGLAYVDDAPPKGVTVVIAGAAGIYAVETAPRR